MKHILLSTTGASPQVLTETLYAIHQSGRSFPAEVFVITTANAKPELMNGLFRDGHLQALKEEYSLPDFIFDENHIWLIEDDAGNYLQDAKSVADQTFMADFITRKVYELTQNDEIAIHASLAGGRKTMAFYFGYAMSLFGREQDVLSHVFVDDDYEFVRDFWYPNKTSRWVAGKFGRGELDTSKAEVTLAEIPFVRMRHSIDLSLLASMAKLSFSQTVGILNASQHAEFNVNLNKSAKLVSVVGIDIQLSAKEMAFYLWLLSKGNEGLKVTRDFEDDIQHSIDFLHFYREVSTDPRVYKSFGSTPEDFRDGDYATLKGMEKTFLQPICSTINHKLRKALPADTSAKLDIEAFPDGSDYYYRVAACALAQPVSITE